MEHSTLERFLSQSFLFRNLNPTDLGSIVQITRTRAASQDEFFFHQGHAANVLYLLVDGKARLVSETYCDGLGACLGECPQDAIHIIEREAVWPVVGPDVVSQFGRNAGRLPRNLPPGRYASAGRREIGGRDELSADGQGRRSYPRFHLDHQLERSRL